MCCRLLFNAYLKRIHIVNKKKNNYHPKKSNVQTPVEVADFSGFDGQSSNHTDEINTS